MKTNYWAKFETDTTYHIYNRGVNGCNLFYSPENYRYFLEKWAHYFHPFLDVYAYCLMPNHFHFMVSPSSEFWGKRLPELDLEGTFPNRPVLHQRLYAVIGEKMTINEFLELQFKDFFGSYSKSINKQEKRTGSLLQQRFKRVKMKSIAQIVEKICYTHHNPIHHGFCKHYDEWQHSSYHAFLGESPTHINRKAVFEFFNEITDVTDDTHVTDTSKVSVTYPSKVSVTYPSKVSVTYNTYIFIKEHEAYRNKPKTQDDYDIND